MLQKNSEFHHFAHQLKIDIKKHKYFIQKIISTPDYVFIKSRTAGKDLYFGLARGAEHSGVVLTDRFPKSSLRGIDSFHEYFKKNAMGAQLKSVDFLEEHKVLRLHMSKANAEFGFMMYWKSTKFYFGHYYYDANELKIRKWWEKLRVEVLDESDLNKALSAVFTLTSNEKAQEAKNIAAFDMAAYEADRDKKDVVKSVVKKKDIKKKNIEKDLEKIKKWELLVEHVNKNKSELIGKKACEIAGYKFKALDSKSDYALVEKIYEKIKSLKKAQIIQEKRLLEITDLKVAELKRNLIFIAPFVAKEMSVISVKKKNEERPNTIEIYKYLNISIAIGLSAQGNDWIRNKWATNEDIWFHLDGISSAHLILKNPDKNTSVLEYTDLVATIFFDKMNLKSKMVSMIYTKVKNLKSVKSKAGLVRYTEQKKIFGNHRPEFLKELIKC